MGKKVSKFYAIKVGKGTENKIVTTWKECEALVNGYPSVYKSFKTKEEAEIYLKEVVVAKVIKQTEYKRKVKATTMLTPQIKIKSELVERFNKKCEEIGLSDRTILESLIKEWLD